MAGLAENGGVTRNVGQRRRAWLPFAVALLVLAGCGGAVTPSASIGTMDDVIANLVLRGATVQRLVSGDPGCPSSDLHSNAISMELAIGSQGSLRSVYLFRWRRPADFEAAAAKFQACVAEYGAQHPGAVVTTLESAPWRAYGPTWNDMTVSLIEEALHASGGR